MAVGEGRRVRAPPCNSLTYPSNAPHFAADEVLADLRADLELAHSSGRGTGKSVTTAVTRAISSALHTISALPKLGSGSPQVLFLHLLCRLLR